MIVKPKPHPQSQNHHDPHHKKHTIDNQRRQILRSRAIIERKAGRDSGTIRGTSHQADDSSPRTLHGDVIGMPTMKERGGRKRTETEQETGEIRECSVLRDIDSDEDNIPDERQHQRASEMQRPFPEIIRRPAQQPQHDRSRGVRRHRVQVRPDSRVAQQGNHLR